MLNTGLMTTVDLNADLGEGEVLTDNDVRVLDTITSASLACGSHAGNPVVMRTTAAACVARGVTIGAHVSYPDRDGFGRRVLERDSEQLVQDIIDQWTVLSDEVRAAGGVVSYVKPHGALYNQMGVDRSVAAAVVEALTRLGRPVLVAPSGTVVILLAREAGLRVVSEGFPDRGYLHDGRLVPRHVVGAMIADPVLVGARAVSMVLEGGIEAVDGVWTPVEVRTLCIHGDARDAADAARSVRTALEANGVSLQSFVRTGPDAPGARASRAR